MSDDRLRVVDEGADAEAEVARARLLPFTASARRYLDAELTQWQTRPVPVLRLPPRRPWIPIAVAGVAVALAASAILFVVPGLSSERIEDPPNLTPRTAEPNTEQARPVVVPPPKPAEVAADNERTLQALDAEAQQKWRNGDLEGARLTFRRMTEREGEHRYVELAFADLVTLARQQGKPGRITALWASYLGRFPRGRFASDARAAICGRPGAPPACRGRAGDGGLGQDPAR